jgi:hypothetical protein
MSERVTRRMRQFLRITRGRVQGVNPPQERQCYSEKKVGRRYGEEGREKGAGDAGRREETEE